MIDRAPRRRADARRNAERLLTAADAAFRADGASAPLERIAREAGVAIGTLYAHFPTRRALVAAVLRERHDALIGDGEELLTRDDVRDALATWTRAVVAHCATYRGLAALIANGHTDEASELHDDCERMAAITARIVIRGRAAGILRDGVQERDVTTLLNAAAWIREQGDPAAADRLVHHGLAGLAA